MITRCENCSSEVDKRDLDRCGYCGLSCCIECVAMHEDDCDQNPANEEDDDSEEEQ